jgi:DNA polymerase I
MPEWEYPGAMLIEFRKGMTLHPGTFNAMIAPGKVMVSALSINTDLQRFLFLYVSGNYSRLLSSINRSSKNFEIRRAFTAHQLFTILKEASHTVVLLEHYPTLFDEAENMIPQIVGMLKEVGHESLVILYTPSVDLSFSVLMRQGDHIIEIAPADDVSGTTMHRSSRSPRNDRLLPIRSGLRRCRSGKEF